MRDLTYPPIILTAKLGFKALGLRFQMHGTENVPRTGGALLALNHISYVDFILGGFATQDSKRLVRFMAKRELFDHRWSGPLMRSLHHISVDRGDGLQSYAQGVDYLRQGEVVGIFPEATISRSFELKEFKTGATRMAAEAGVPLVPAVLWGTQRLKTKSHPQDFSRGKTIAISVGTPLHPTGENSVAETAELKAAMARLLDETIRAYPADEQPPGSWWLPASYGGSAPTPEEAAVLDAEEKRERAKARAAKRQR
ncbi:1-acyl-sn-glycerol-3-phosphate acyltransferase [Nocardioides panacis]|uniref:1-acyl-sn-glycerol-3-phosphate acyltransferase n=1 Tax=Nocardioides panacis TaxID=2849501 RepID=A0A975SXI7_9ACTN|nr:lysophospholipid acyltransferase family protein [Nocardioides panacis]QWZ07681.1 1-acyl-sn-glycerol-3-phosphate acyltransferase [Nocardioides panacis]